MLLSDYVTYLTKLLAHRGDSEIIFTSNDKGAFDAVDINEITLNQNGKMKNCLEFCIRSSSSKSTFDSNDMDIDIDLDVKFSDGEKTLDLDNISNLPEDEKSSFIDFLRNVTEESLEDFDLSSCIKGVKVENGVVTPFNVNNISELPNEIKESLFDSLKGLADKLEEGGDDDED